MTKDNKIHLFLSYGHESKNSRIIELILAELKKEFIIWIDKRDIPDHEDWRREILKGISETDMTLGLLSKYSTRERGVCLDELGISISIPGRKLITVLLENQKRISLPSTVTRNQWLDLSQWKKYVGTDQWSDYFYPKMKDLVASIKSKGNIEFQGEIRILHKILKPEAFNSKASGYINSKHTVLRPWLIQQVSKWLQDSSSGRFLLITGDAGTGKSHFSAMYQHYNPVCAAGVFFEHGKVNSNYVKDMIRYLIYILSTKYPDYRFQLLQLFRQEELIDENDTVQDVKCAEFFSSHTAENLFDRFLCSPVIGGSNTNLAIVFDGLDEVSVGEDNPMLTFFCSDLFSRLQPHLKIIITTRAEPSIMHLIQKNKPRQINLNTEISNSDIQQYIQSRLSSIDPPPIFSQQDISKLVERSNQMFLFAKLACDAIEDGSITAQNISDLPDGVGGLFTCYFDRLFPESGDYEKVKPFLRIICAFDTGPLSESFLIRVVHTDMEALNGFYHSMKSFAQSRIVDRKSYVYLFHKALYDWLTDRSLSGKYFIDTSLGIHQIAEAVKEIISESSEETDHEFLKNSYQFILAHGHTVQISLDARFLYIIQLSSYNNSDLELYKEVLAKIERITELTGDTKLYILSKSSLTSWYYDVALEQEKALDLLNELNRNYSDIINKDPELYTSAELNRIYITDSCKGNHEESLEQEKSLSQYISSCSTESLPSKGRILAKSYYHRSLIEFRLGKYDDSIRSADQAAEIADISHKDPRKLKCLVYIIQGASFRKKKQFAESLEVLHKSLEYRLSLYGFSTLFVANSYHNLDDALYDQAIHTGADFDPRLYEYLENYRRIILSVVGEKNPRMMHYYLTMANISERNGDIRKALEYAHKVLQYKTKYYGNSHLYMQQLIDRHKEMYLSMGLSSAE